MHILDHNNNVTVVGSNPPKILRHVIHRVQHHTRSYMFTCIRRELSATRVVAFSDTCLSDQTEGFINQTNLPIQSTQLSITF